MTEPSERHRRGLGILRQLGGENALGPVHALREIAPDLARFTVEFAYGDVVSDPALDLPTRELCTVAALAGLGTARAQLLYHVEGALHVGCAAPQIVEVLLLNCVYAGFPAALNGVLAAREVFEKRGLLPLAASAAGLGADAETLAERRARGARTLARVSGTPALDVLSSLQQTAPDLANFILEFSYGDVLGRPGLDDRTRELASVALLTALGTAAPQLEVHVSAALRVGASVREIVAVIEQMAVYAGFPAALNAVASARQVFAARGLA